MCVSRARPRFLIRQENESLCGIGGGAQQEQSGAPAKEAGIVSTSRNDRREPRRREPRRPAAFRACSFYEEPEDDELDEPDEVPDESDELSENDVTSDMSTFAAPIST